MSQDTKTFTRADADALVRSWNLFYNRTIAYAFDHPVAQETIPRVYESFGRCMGPQGTLSLLFQEFGYYIGHIDMAYQSNNRRIADHLRRFGIESISISTAPTLDEFSRFLDACTLTHANPLKFLEYLTNQGITCFSVNDVSLQTVKEGDIPGGTGGPGGGSGGISWDGAPGAGRASSFDDVAMRVVLGHLTAQEMNANLSLLRVLETPGAIPDAIVSNATQQGPQDQAKTVKQSLLNVVGAFKASASQENVPLEDLLAGMYNMRSELLKAVKAQQGLAQITNKEEVAAITDEVFANTAVQLLVDEYRKCKGNPKRMAQVIRRIVPEKVHLQQVMTLFRQELQKQGVPLIDFYNLLSELNALVGTDQSYQQFVQAGQALGVSAEELLSELQQDPKQAAQLIILASEARKVSKNGSGEEMIRNLADMVEQAGEAMGERVAANPKEAPRLSSMLQQMETEVNRQLQAKDMPEEARVMGQQKLRHRMQQSVLDIKGKAAMAQLRNPSLSDAEKAQFLLEIFSDEKEMEDVMSLVKDTMGTEEVAKEVGNQVMQKVRHEMSTRREKHFSKELPPGVYVKAVLDFFIKFEISRALRYQLPFSAILLSFQGLPEDKPTVDQQGDALRGLQNVLIGDLRKFLRDSDFVGYLSFNRFLVVLPMTKLEVVPTIVRKFQENLNRQLALPNGSRLSIRPRCGSAAFDKENANSYPKIYAELVKSWQNDR